MIDDPLGAIEYGESGTGPTVVLVPGSCGTGAAWRPVIAAWEGRFRCVTTSLLGYGATVERRTAADTDIAHEAEAVEAVIRRAASPVHLVGHSFGGLVALAVALRGRVALRSLNILEAPAVMLLRDDGDMRHYLQVRQMSDMYAAEFRSGRTDAIATMIDFYGGKGTFAGWPARARDYAIARTSVNLLDWESAYGFRLSPEMLARLRLPTLVVRGGDSHPAIRRANELLTRHIAGSILVTMDTAAHFMLASHPNQVAYLLGRHFAIAAGAGSDAAA